jgi:hypothetical protein
MEHTNEQLFAILNEIRETCRMQIFQFRREPLDDFQNQFYIELAVAWGKDMFAETITDILDHHNV